jgi:hypothetical protein
MLRKKLTNRTIFMRMAILGGVKDRLTGFAEDGD